MRDWYTVPEGETDEVHLTPEAFLAVRLERLNLTPARAAVPPTVLLTFQSEIAEQFVRETHARPAGQGFSFETSVPMWRGTLGTAPVMVAKLPIGAAAATIALELLIACGARTFVMAGNAGSLTPDAPIGAIIVPTGALREEGLSYHYLPPDAEPGPDAELVEGLVAATEMRGRKPLAGRVWTTDAIFREMGWKVRQYGAAGILAVEMELAALMAVVQTRGARFGAVLAISDELFHPWMPGWHAEEYATGRILAANVALDVAAAVNVSRRTED
jgi:uridine phosphorylase